MKSSASRTKGFIGTEFVTKSREKIILENHDWIVAPYWLLGTTTMLFCVEFVNDIDVNPTRYLLY